MPQIHCALILLCAVLVSLSSASAQEPAADGPSTAATDDRTVMRLDPIERRLVPAPNIRPGLVYSRWNEALGRRVWSIAQEGGGFAFSFGEGTTMPVDEFDIPYEEDVLIEMIEARAPRWAGVSQSAGMQSFARLNGQNEWELVRRRTIKSVFDLDTHRRWEWHGERQVPVQHTGGYLWQILEGSYVPLGIIHMSMTR